MNEDRLINLVLWIALGLGTAGLFLFHFAVPEHPKTVPVRPPSARVETPSPKESGEIPVPAPATAPVPPGPAEVPENPSELETQTAQEIQADSPPPAEETTPPLPEAREPIPLAPKSAEEGTPERFPEPREALALLKKAGLMKTPEPEEATEPSGPSQDIIQETTGANGTFYSAQMVTEGLIIGKRGTADDRSDYFKVRASGPTMTLELEPIPEKDNRRFRIFLFDADFKAIPEPEGGTVPSISLEVTPDALYYIRIDLSKAPIQTPEYRLRLKFR